MDIKRRAMISTVALAPLSDVHATRPRVNGLSTPRLVFVGASAEPAAGDTFNRFRGAMARVVAARAKRTQAQSSSTTWRYAWMGEGDQRAIDTHVRKHVAPMAADLFVCANASAAMALAKWPEREVPVVFASFLDPVDIALASSYRRPGRRMTGVSVADDLHAKRLELMIDAFPTLRHVGILLDHWWADVSIGVRAMPTQVSGASTRVTTWVADTRHELERVWERAERAGVQAWYIPATFIAEVESVAVLAYIKRHRAPAIFATAQEVERGACMAYTQDTSFVLDSMANLVLRVLAGEDAGEIPIERPRKFELIVRPDLQTRLGRVDTSLVLRADRVLRGGA